MKKNERHALFSRFLTEEAWEFDRANKWMIGHASKRPTSTSILFKAVLPQQPGRAIALGQELAATQIQNSHHEDAMEILGAIWRLQTEYGTMPVDAIKPGLQLAGLYEQNGRREDAMEIRRAVKWID